MAIVCCAIPDFPLALLARAEAAVWERPVALTDPDERVIAATPPAQAAGVSAGQSARQARLLCRELHLQAADLPAAEGEFAALLALLDDYSDAVEPFKLGSAYLTAPDLDERSAPGFCTALGSGIRCAFGQALQPAIGCDQGKFTASAAARRTRTGAVRVVLGAAEQPFLRPLPVGWLPLSAVHQRLLRYLGIDTLGQFADLPPPAVFQQFGAAGRLAQHWAQGQDDRPVIARSRRPIQTGAVTFEPPLETLPPLAAVAERLLAPWLLTLRDRLQAAQSLQATLQFVDGRERSDAWRLAAPSTDGQRFLSLLTGRWQSEPWTQPLQTLSLSLGDIQEAPGEQLTLFAGSGAAADLLGEWVTALRLRYGAGCFLQAEMVDAQDLRPERRSRWLEYAAFVPGGNHAGYDFRAA